MPKNIKYLLLNAQLLHKLLWSVIFLKGELHGSIHRHFISSFINICLNNWKKRKGWHISSASVDVSITGFAGYVGRISGKTRSEVKLKLELAPFQKLSAQECCSLSGSKAKLELFLCCLAFAAFLIVHKELHSSSVGLHVCAEKSTVALAWGSLSSALHKWYGVHCSLL